MDNPTVALALGQGGARGLAHIGVIQVLQDHGYRIESVAGTSIGAIVGAMFAQSLDGYAVEERFAQFVESEVYQDTGFTRLLKRSDREASFWDQITCRIRDTVALNLAQARMALLKGERFQKSVEFLVQAHSFDDCRIPFTSVATDLIQGQVAPMTSGDLIQAVIASASIPGFLPPVERDHSLLADGAICCPVPVPHVICEPQTVIIGSAVRTGRIRSRHLDNALDVMIRAEEINLQALSKNQMDQADVQVYSRTGEIQWNRFEQLKEAIQLGRQAAESILPEIEKAMKRKNSWIWQTFCRPFIE